MSMPFREVLETVLRILNAERTAHPSWEITILRDVLGTVRVMVEAQKDLPTEEQLAGLARSLRGELGEWVGDGVSPVWHPAGVRRSAARPSVQALVDEIKKRRRAVGGLFLAELHVSREAWTGALPHAPPWPLAEVDEGRAPAILTFFSHKGGVGRTTTLVAMAMQFARANKQVALVDLDLEAPGLGSVFPGARGKEGVLDLLVARKIAPGDVGAVAMQVAEEHLVAGGPPLAVLPAGEVDDAYLEMLARLDLGAHADRAAAASRLARLFATIREWRPELDHILVDARAGFHDVGGLMLGTLTHGAVVIATTNPQSQLGVSRVARLLSRRGSPEPPLPLFLAHGLAPEIGIPNAENETNELRRQAYDMLTAEYYLGPPPAWDERSAPHHATPMPWSGPLRGGGGPITPSHARLLSGDEQQELARRILARFPGRR